MKKLLLMSVEFPLQSKSVMMTKFCMLAQKVDNSKFFLFKTINLLDNWTTVDTNITNCI